MSEELTRDVEPCAPRWALIAFPLLHAFIFYWGASIIPYRASSLVFALLMIVGTAHLVAGLAALIRSRLTARALPYALRISSWLSLFAFLYPAFEIVRNANYLGVLYGDLGQGIGLILLMMLAPLALVTLPIAIWGLVISRGVARPRISLAIGGALFFAALALILIDRASARAEALAPNAPSDEEIAQQLQRAHREIFGEPAGRGAADEDASRNRRLLQRSAMECVSLVPSAELTAAVIFLAPNASGRGARTVERCFREEPDALARAIFEAVRAEAIEGSAVKIDLYRAAAPLKPRSALLGTFSIRPGLDGVCNDSRCLMPWQLVALSEFSANQPIPYIPDLRFGVSASRLRMLLGEEMTGDAVADEEGAELPEQRVSFEGLYRLETSSFVLTQEGELIRLVRGREAEVGLDRLDEALDLAEAHIADAQRPDGFFRYRLDPHSGREHSGWSLPRQAGTTLVMCELGRDAERTEKVAARSISLMLREAKREKASANESAKESAKESTKNESTNEIAALGSSDRFALGDTALPLISIYSCLHHVDARERKRAEGEAPATEAIDRGLIGGLTRFLLRLQRESGGFYPAYEFGGAGLIEGAEPLYAGGQAVFALTLAERLAIQSPEEAAKIGLPAREVLTEAVERAMNFYARDYWPRFSRELFFLEENWHCLAARAALDHHRNADYEDFCLDYARFKSRIVLDGSSRVAPELIGGHSLGNIIVPSNTPTAGLGEALAGAMAVREARGDDLADDRETMRLILGYLLRQQWTPRNCFACTTHRTVVGGFSEAISIPEIRIDYTQHAWAALGHGGRFLRGESVAVERAP